MRHLLMTGIVYSKSVKETNVFFGNLSPCPLPFGLREGGYRKEGLAPLLASYSSFLPNQLLSLKRRDRR